MSDLLKQIVAAIVEALAEALPKEKILELFDKGLDKVEAAIVKSENKFDDAIVLPLIKELIREPFGIVDNDPVEAPPVEKAP